MNTYTYEELSASNLLYVIKCSPREESLLVSRIERWPSQPEFAGWISTRRKCFHLQFFNLLKKCTMKLLRSNICIKVEPTRYFKRPIMYVNLAFITIMQVIVYVRKTCSNTVYRVTYQSTIFVYLTRQKFRLDRAGQSNACF